LPGNNIESFLLSLTNLYIVPMNAVGMKYIITRWF